MSPSPLQHRKKIELDRLAGISPAKTVSLPLATLTRLLADAAAANRAWLGDFADDMVRVDADLHEVLLAYQQVHRATV